jgi:hypothetical protein
MNEIAQPDEVENYLLALVMNKIGLPMDSRWLAWLKQIIKNIVSGFAEKATAFDEAVGLQGFQASASDWLRNWVSSINIFGQEHLPVNEPLVIAANHPGTFDSLALASILPRDDLKIVTAGNPFFRSLPNTRQYLIYATNDSYVRMATIRKALRHLNEGGSLLLFPSGKVDPDPDYFQAEAKQSLARWSDSLELFLRKAPQSKLVIAINSGFVAPEFVQNPLLRLHPVKITRQYIAEFFQVIQLVSNNRMVSNKPQVCFSEPFSLADLAGFAGDFQERIFTLAANLLEFNRLAE